MHVRDVGEYAYHGHVQYRLSWEGPSWCAVEAAAAAEVTFRGDWRRYDAFYETCDRGDIYYEALTDDSTALLNAFLAHGPGFRPRAGGGGGVHRAAWTPSELTITLDAGPDRAAVLPEETQFDDLEEHLREQLDWDGDEGVSPDIAELCRRVPLIRIVWGVGARRRRSTWRGGTWTTEELRPPGPSARRLELRSVSPISLAPFQS